jgi:hypothetical protein
MSVNSYEVNVKQRGSYGVDYNGLSMMYRQAIQDHHFKRAKEIEADMKREDGRLAEEGEQ